MNDRLRTLAGTLSVLAFAPVCAPALRARVLNFWQARPWVFLGEVLLVLGQVVAHHAGETVRSGRGRGDQGGDHLRAAGLNLGRPGQARQRFEPVIDRFREHD